MNKIDQVLIEMATMENLNEHKVIRLCIKYELSFAEEIKVMNMFYEAFGYYETTLQPKEQLAIEVNEDDEILKRAKSHFDWPTVGDEWCDYVRN